MKNYKAISISLFLLIASFINSYGQDLTDEKNFTTIKNIKSSTTDLKNKKHYAILNNNFFLEVEYNVLVSDNENANYTFIVFPSDPEAMSHSLTLLLNNLPYMLQTLGIDQQYYPNFTSDIKKAFSEEKDTYKSKVLINFLFLNKYDQCNLLFKNEDSYFSCEFFFERMF